MLRLLEKNQWKYEHIVEIFNLAITFTFNIENLERES